MKGLITIVSYNRLEAIKKLLFCLSKLKLNDNDNDIDLIVSIDHSSSQNKIFKSICNFQWPHGHFKIIKEKSNLGLKKHVLKCGDRVINYDYVVLIEEDIIISPTFFDFAIPAIKLSQNDELIGGISLYTYTKNEEDKQTFQPLLDSYDNFFLQFPSSWGSIYTLNQWKNFTNWLSKNDCDSFNDTKVPNYICSWPKQSWKKHMVRYLVNNNKYFLYPRFSLATNPGINGVHHHNIGSLYSVPVCLEKRSWHLSTTKESNAFYDVNFCSCNFEFLTSHYLFDGHISSGTISRLDKADFILSSYYLSFSDLISICQKFIVMSIKKLIFKLKRFYK